ncbi:glycosyltransferase family 87 protein [Haloferax marisrubri]|uniref:DUF2029 domain-containing protein n=1 Tax=Haloferax marisrubri TaxID=1544719 RepID=A0A2P4NQU6_9EURY|nr:glycosyltransferase family 87 protein [Haloferax marisrubri]POG55526.1 DUF2029 domain-containing protein [Haloferax marisrubri]
MGSKYKEFIDYISQDSEDKFGKWIFERIPLIFGICLGVLSFLFLLFFSEGGDGHAARAYWLAANGFIEDGRIYGYFPGYMYSPITLVIFLPYAFVSFLIAFGIQATTAILAAIGLGWITIEFISDHGRNLSSTDKSVIFVFFLASSLSIPAYMQAQINTHLALIIAVGFVAIERDKQVKGGVALATAALFKAIPALLGVWQLHRRKYKSVVVSILVGVGGLAFGAVIFGIESTEKYIFEILLVRRNSDALVGGISPESAILTIKQPIGVLLPWVDNTVLTILAILLVVPIVTYVFHVDSIESTIQTRVLGMLTITIAMLVVTPSYFYYMIYATFPLVSALFLVEKIVTRICLAIGTCLTVSIFTADDFAVVIELLPLPALVSNPIIETIYTVMSISTLPLLGVILIQFGAVHYCHTTHR